MDTVDYFNCSRLLGSFQDDPIVRKYSRKRMFQMIPIDEYDSGVREEYEVGVRAQLKVAPSLARHAVEQRQRRKRKKALEP